MKPTYVSNKNLGILYNAPVRILSKLAKRLFLYEF